MADYYLLAFWLFVLAALAIGWRAGDRADRRMILAIIGATAASAMVYTVTDIGTALYCVIAIDLALLAIVGNYALKGGKYWPVWFTGLHGTSVLFEALALTLPADAGIAFWRVAGFWSLPALLAMSAGLMLDQSRQPQGSPDQASTP